MSTWRFGTQAISPPTSPEFARNIRGNYALFLAESNRFREAEPIAKELVAEFRGCGDLRQCTRAMRVLATSLALQRRLDEAVDCLNCALEQAQAINHEYEMAAVHAELAQVWIWKGNLEKAESHLKHYIPLVAVHEKSQHAVDFVRIQLALLRGNQREVEKLSQRLRPEAFARPFDRVQLLIVKQQVAQMTGKTRLARSLMRRLLHTAEAHGVEFLLGEMEDGGLWCLFWECLPTQAFQ